MKKLLIALSLLLCLSMVGQVMAIEIVLDNFALGGSASTSASAWGWVESRAVDGNPGSGYHSPETQEDHWWEVDMGSSYDFERIEVLSRSGGNPPYVDRLNGAIVIALDVDRNVVFTGAAVSGSPLVIQYDNGGAGFTGVQYIRVEKPYIEGTERNILTLMEVRAQKIATVVDPQEYVVPIPNAVAMQTTPNASYPASNALDGNYGNFTHTDSGSANNYWEVDLSETIDIPAVKVYNRSSCCGNRLINTVLSIMDEDRNVVFSRKFTSADGIGNGSAHTVLTAATGRYVRIGLENGEANGDNNYVISLAEVEIVGWVFPPPNGEIPIDGTIDISPDQDLGWLPGADPNGNPHSGTSGYHLYLGSDERAVNRRDDDTYVGFIEVGNEIYDAPLVKDTTYYWAVDQQIGLGDGNSIRGYNWSFTTELTLPIVDAQPVDAVTFDDGYAIFTVAATNPLPEDLMYEWVKVGDGTVLSTTDTLEIYPVNAGDAGQYFCRISNINTIVSDTVSLRVAKPVVDWRFNETSGSVASDSSGNAIDGTLGFAFGDEDWIVDGGRTGQAGDNALRFPNDPNASVLALDVDLPGKGVTNIFDADSSWTLIMWINLAKPINAITNLGGFGSCEYVEGDGSGSSGRYFAGWDTSALEFEYGAWGLWPETYLQADQWQMLAATYDAPTQTLRLYYDGVQVSSTADLGLNDTTENAFKINSSGLVLFNDSVDTQGAIDGLVDDFSVWDDALGAFELNSLIDGYNCIEQIEGDMNNDCLINVEDLAAALSSWLGCATVPDCL